VLLAEFQLRLQKGWVLRQLVLDLLLPALAPVQARWMPATLLQMQRQLRVKWPCVSSCSPGDAVRDGK
jgi:hypothetical protein